MKASVSAIVAAFLLAAPPARADDMTLVQSAKPIIHNYTGRSIDVLGITFGMMPDQVKAILLREYGVEPETEQGSINVNFSGIKIHLRNL